MSIEKVRDYFKSLGAEDKIITFDVSSATVELASQALGVDGALIAKTLSFMVEGAPVLIVTAGDMKVDNSKFKATFHTKAKMLTYDEAHELIGHDVGGVCPFAVNEGCRVYLDVSLKRFEVVYPAAGNASSAIRLTIPELESFSNYIDYVDVCKSREA
ncbi:MAG: YbaK/EbsC family protein [Clostridia bacterium]|nr:YbaK/EbsC family protein [Clostridia bacterium]